MGFYDLFVFEVSSVENGFDLGDDLFHGFVFVGVVDDCGTGFHFVHHGIELNSQSVDLNLGKILVGVESFLVLGKLGHGTGSQLFNLGHYFGLELSEFCFVFSDDSSGFGEEDLVHFHCFCLDGGFELHNLSDDLSVVHVHSCVQSLNLLHTTSLHLGVHLFPCQVSVLHHESLVLSYSTRVHALNDRVDLRHLVRDACLQVSQHDFSASSQLCYSSLKLSIDSVELNGEFVLDDGVVFLHKWHDDALVVVQHVDRGLFKVCIHQRTLGTDHRHEVGNLVHAIHSHVLVLAGFQLVHLGEELLCSSSLEFRGFVDLDEFQFDEVSCAHGERSSFLQPGFVVLLGDGFQVLVHLIHLFVHGDSLDGGLLDTEVDKLLDASDGVHNELSHVGLFGIPESTSDLPVHSHTLHTSCNIDVGKSLPCWSGDIHGDELSDNVAEFSGSRGDGVLGQFEDLFGDLVEGFGGDSAVLVVETILNGFNLLHGLVDDDISVLVQVFHVGDDFVDDSHGSINGGTDEPLGGV